MKKFLLSISIALIFLAGCSTHSNDQLIENQQDSDANSNLTPQPTINTTSFTVTASHQGKINLNLEQQKQLFVSLDFSDGSRQTGRHRLFYHPQLNLFESIFWYSNNESIAKVTSSGILQGINEGQTNIQARLGNQVALWTVTVEKNFISPDPIAPIIDKTPGPIQNEPLPQPSENQQIDWADHLNSLTLIEGETTTLALYDFFNDQPIESDSSDLSWQIENPNIATVEEGSLTAIYPGSTKVIVTFEDQTFEKNIEVQLRLENPIHLEDRFLGDADVLTPSFTITNGFGFSSFPEIVYGPPVDTYSVVSFGIGGSLDIEFGDYMIVDGPGPDFTIFENPFYTGVDINSGGWLECAEVEVSENGDDWFSFSCDPHNLADGYPGCAGRTPVNYGLQETSYLNTNLSGGDTFDLSDLHEPSLKKVRYLRLTDLELCAPEPQNNFAGSSAGFDFNALVIINGQRF